MFASFKPQLPKHLNLFVHKKQVKGIRGLKFADDNCQGEIFYYQTQEDPFDGSDLPNTKLHSA